MIKGLESISISTKILHLVLTFVTQNNIDKCAEERPIKHFPLTLSLVCHSRPHICPTFCLPIWPILHSGTLSWKFFKVCSSRLTHYRPSQGQHRLGTSSLKLKTAQHTVYFMQPSKDRWIISPILLRLRLLIQCMKKSHKTKRAIFHQILEKWSLNFFS